ncbi:hypothetical protein [Streptomyces sp. NPDC059008]|uniref:hypothetical protein n=1 Tax=Streptomyces sp. NPDC059008 TaxID=3346693 RepID=UPI003691596A
MTILLCILAVMLGGAATASSAQVHNRAPQTPNVKRLTPESLAAGGISTALAVAKSFGATCFSEQSALDGFKEYLQGETVNNMTGGKMKRIEKVKGIWDGSYKSETIFKYLPDKLEAVFKFLKYGIKSVVKQCAEGVLKKAKSSVKSLLDGNQTISDAWAGLMGDAFGVQVGDAKNDVPADQVEDLTADQKKEVSKV